MKLPCIAHEANISQNEKKSIEKIIICKTQFSHSNIIDESWVAAAPIIHQTTPFLNETFEARQAVLEEKHTTSAFQYDKLCKMIHSLGEAAYIRAQLQTDPT